MGKTFRISLKLNFTPKTLGCYGLKPLAPHQRNFPGLRFAQVISFLTTCQPVEHKNRLPRKRYTFQMSERISCDFSQRLRLQSYRDASRWAVQFVCVLMWNSSNVWSRLLISVSTEISVQSNHAIRQESAWFYCKPDAPRLPLASPGFTPTVCSASSKSK